MALTAQQRQQIIEDLRSRTGGQTPSTISLGQQRIDRLRGTQPSTPLEPQKPPSREGGALDIATDVATGFGKGAVSTFTGISSLGERGLRFGLQAALPKSLERRFGIRDEEEFQPAAQQLIPEELRTPEGRAQKFGFAAEQIAEFLLPSAKIAKAEKGLSLLARAGTEAGIAGAQRAVQKGKIDRDVATTAIIGGLFPVVGAGIKGTAKKLGERVQTTVIKPSQKDVKDGFDIVNVNKHKVGGNLQETLSKTQSKMNDLSGELSRNLEAGQSRIDMNKIFNKTTDELLQGKKARQFGDIGSIKRVTKQLKSEISEVADDLGTVDLVDATNIKRGAGSKGAWAFGRIEPDASAVEKVYTKFYQNIRKEIEDKAPEGLKGINKQLSELIPISNAVIRRIPVDARNNAISLTDSIALFASIFNPKALTVFGANRLLKSGKFGAFLSNVAAKQRTGIGARFLGNN